jgi:uncharacterized repeat protein (TIGR02543 family)
MAAKVFEVGDVLPATTQLRITSNNENIHHLGGTGQIKTDNDNFVFIDYNVDFPDGPSDFFIDGINYYSTWVSLEKFVLVNTSSWSLSKRTVSTVSGIFAATSGDSHLFWEDIAPAPSGYTITFNSNGGTTISDIEEATELPTPLPTPTKSGYTFVAWYYESNFQTRAVAGATIEEDTTLYAKWHNLGSLFTEIANAIREKESSSGTIRDVDFGERVKQIQGAKEEETKTITPDFSSGNQVITPTSGKVLSQVTINKDANFIADNLKKDVTAFGITGTSYIAIELTQAQYDALGTKDANTYYLIVEE